MDFLNGKIKPIYFRYLAAAFGSAMITSVYSIVDMAPAIVRTYALSFLLLPFNIFSTYYFQAIMKPQAAFVVSVARGLVISGILILVLPVLVSTDSLWLAMPITELAVMLYAAAAMRKYTGELTEDPIDAIRFS